VGELAPDFTLQTPDGQSVTLSDLCAEKPVVLEFGCITCPIYRGKIAYMQKLHQRYGDDMHFVVVYTVEAHPNDTPSPYSGKIWPHKKNEQEGVLLSHPTTYEERVVLAQRLVREYGEERLIMIDGMDNAVWEEYGKRPNSAFVIAQGGEVELKQFWAEPRELQQYLGGAEAGGDGGQQALELEGDVWVLRDIEYTVADGHSLKLDAYLPADKQIHPAVVWIHGGGWRDGGKNPFRDRGLRYAQDGVAAFSINYRLSGVARYPAAVEDCVRAIRWIRSHAGDYNIDPDRLGVQGSSAGGHLSLMTAFLEPSEDDISASGEPLDNFVVCVVSQWGPTDFTADDSMHQHPAVLQFMGTTMQEAPDRFAEASPVTHVSPDDPPVLLVHGTEDQTVPYSQATILYRRLQQAGVLVELITIEGGGHGLKGGDRQEIEMADTRVHEFMLKHLLGGVTE